MERPNKNKRVVRDEKQRELKLEDVVSPDTSKFYTLSTKAIKKIIM